MRIVICILIICIESEAGFCQGFTNIWQLGYDSDTLPECLIDFSSGAAIASTINRPMSFTATNASICDSSGQLLFYTNGVYVANKNHDTLLNGSGLNPGP